MNAKIHRSAPDFSVIHTDILNLEGLSLSAIGLAAKITYIEMCERDYKKSAMEVWKMIEDNEYHAAYDELVKREVINDFLEDLRYEH